MTTCGTNVIQVSECDDVYAQTVSYDLNTEILTITLTNGTIYTTVIPQGDIVLSNVSGNRIVQLPDGLYVSTAETTINGFAYQEGDNLSLVSTDGTVGITVAKTGTNVSADLSCNCDDDSHPDLSVNPNVAYSFDATNQTLNIPLPTLTQVPANDNIFYYEANDGSGDAFSIVTHPSLIVDLNEPTSFDSTTQILKLATPTLTDNGDQTYTYDAGDGTGTTFVIDTTGSSVDVCDELATCSLSNFGDVDLTGLSTGDVIKWNGTAWVPSADETSGGAGAISSIVNNNDGTFTHNNGNGTNTIIQMPVGVLTDNADGTITYTDGIGNSYVINLATSTIVNNNDGTFTHTDSINGSTVITMPASVLVDNNDGTYTHDDGLGNETIIDVSTSTTENPFALQGSAQQTRATDLPIDADVYRTGTTGFGVEQAETSQGQVEVRGNTYLTNTGTEEQLVYQTNYGATVDEIAVALNTLTTVYQYQVKNATRSLQVTDENGNLGIGEVDTLTGLPDDTYNAESTISISNDDNKFSPPETPISVWSATDFVLVI